MNACEAAIFLKEGYRIRRKAWTLSSYVFELLDELYVYDSFSPALIFSLSLSDLLADDWVIMTNNIVKHFPKIIYSD